jgi:DNA-binding Xre family transcriptional regulator
LPLGKRVFYGKVVCPVSCTALALVSVTQPRAKEIAEATGLSRHTINGLLIGDSKAIYFDTIGKLIQFFQERGMMIAVQDLIVVESTDT